MLEPEKDPFEAKAMNEGTSDMISWSPALILLERSSLTPPRADCKSPICTICELTLPAGQMALATPGACWIPVLTILATSAVVTESVSFMTAETSGSPRRAKPAVNAVKMSDKRTLVFFSGSISLMMGAMTRFACVVAN